MKRILITTPIYYINAAPHIGSATTCVLADFFKRLYKLRGYDAYLTTGTDENGQKIQKANDSNVSLEEFQTKNAESFRETFDRLEVDYDRFIRTTETEHHQMVIKIWNMLKNAGHIYEGVYRGYYCVSDETFYTEKDLKLVNGKYYTKDDKLAENTERPAYFLRLSNIRDEILRFYNTHENFTYPKNRVNELIGFIEEGFKDLCISRQDNIGVHIPNSDHTVYVWFDALINYVTASKCVLENGKLIQREYWDNVVHLVGKDILTFHGLFWIAMLMLAGLLPNQIRVFCHNWWVFPKQGDEKGVVKMSKSLGNVVDPHYLMDKYGVDCVRFYFIYINLVNSDSVFNENEMIEAFNKYMVGKFSNLVHRVYGVLKKIGLNDIEGETRNEKYEGVLLNCDLDINKYMRTLFEWCDALNEKVTLGKIWENTELTKEVAKELNVLQKYFVPIAPATEARFKDKHLNPIFKTIIKSD